MPTITKGEALKRRFMRELTNACVEYAARPTKRNEAKIARLERALACPHDNVRMKLVNNGYGVDWTCSDCKEIVDQE